VWGVPHCGLRAGGDEAEIAQMMDDVTVDLFALAELAASDRLEVSVRLAVAGRQFMPAPF
jgi:hypothetical protein